MSIHASTARLKNHKALQLSGHMSPLILPGALSAETQFKLILAAP